MERDWGCGDDLNINIYWDWGIYCEWIYLRDVELF
jgi:hypothetical protein